MIRIILVFAIVLSAPLKSEANSNASLELNSVNLLLEEIAECMAFYNVQYNIRLKEQNFDAANRALLYHQNLTMLATGLTHQTQSFSQLPQLHRSKLENILQEMHHLYSKIATIERKYETNCLELTNNFEKRRKYWKAHAKFQIY